MGLFFFSDWNCTLSFVFVTSEKTISSATIITGTTCSTACNNKVRFFFGNNHGIIGVLCYSSLYSCSPYIYIC